MTVRLPKFTNLVDWNFVLKGTYDPCLITMPANMSYAASMCKELDCSRVKKETFSVIKDLP